MRKDFLVDPYQILEARAAEPAACLVILRMLGMSASPNSWMRSRASFVRSFGSVRRRDLETARRLLSSRGTDETILIGIKQP